MTHLVDIIAYLAKKYPYKNELSKARLTKMVYLSDWKFAITYGSQMTNLNWFFDNYGPFVWDIIDIVRANPKLFEVEETVNAFGANKSLISIKTPEYVPNISNDEKNVLDFVIESTKELTWKGFINLVYSTYPIVMSERYSPLDLPKLAKVYNNKEI